MTKNGRAAKTEPQQPPDPIILRDMTAREQARAAREFAAEWTKIIEGNQVDKKGSGNERKYAQTFWLDLLEHVLGVKNPKFHIAFEEAVQSDTTSFADGYIARTCALIEQKASSKDLDEKITQSNGMKLTPFEQAVNYSAKMSYSRRARWIVTCNFREFRIYDMEYPDREPEKIALGELENKVHHLHFLTDDRYISNTADPTQEVAASEKAGDVVANIYEALLEECEKYGPVDADLLHALNVLCVRLVFCFYAESAGVFGRYGMFREYMHNHRNDARSALDRLFKVLDTPVEKRERFLEPELAQFPYVNGGLFRDVIEMPPIPDDVAYAIFFGTEEGFNWRDISPTIFGAIFESTLNPKTRKTGGMHYTSVENIEKVIGPLFLDDLKAELAAIKGEYQEAREKSELGSTRKSNVTARRLTPLRNRNKALAEFQKKLASLKFFDPACGSGNFLTATYKAIRELENEAIEASLSDYGGTQVGMVDANPIMVSIEQFYGIEINDFAVSVAQTALWITEAQMLRETEAIIQRDIEFLPLTSAGNIVQGNALRMDWNDVAPSDEIDYIMGNPPFVGYAYQSPEQKSDLRLVFDNSRRNVDYVSGWFWLAARYMNGTNVQAAFVATNSITMGEQVAAVWGPLLDCGIHIDFAWTTFKWGSEATSQAHVHVVVIGFSAGNFHDTSKLYTFRGVTDVRNISPYLTSGPNLFVTRRSKPLCNVPVLVRGSQPTDDGNLILTENEKNELLKVEPQAEPLLRPFVQAHDFIARTPRWCLWLVGKDPSMLKKCPHVLQRVQAVRRFRAASTKVATKEKADIPTLFDEVRISATRYVAVPKTSSERRRYVPMEYLEPDIVPGDAVFFMEAASLYHFGILTSNVHMAWMRTVAGRLKSDYRYSNTLVYNTFPWPDPTPEQKAKIEQTAQAILDARALYPNASLADLYDDTTMPPELRKAHEANNRAVMKAYGFNTKMDEPEIVAKLMQMYADLAAEADA